MTELFDGAGDKIEINDGGFEDFRASVFGIIGYYPGVNDARVISYLNLYRQQAEGIQK